jgi:hypothetical protein
VVPPPVVPPPVVPPPVVPPEPPHTEAHSVVQLLQMQVPMALNSLTGVMPAVVAHICSQLVSPCAQLLRQPMSVLQALSFWQVLSDDAQEPPLPRTVSWHMPHGSVEPVVPPVEPVVPPVEPVLPPVEPVVPPPHCDAHCVEQVEQTQERTAFSKLWLAAGAALLQFCWQVASAAAQFCRHCASVAQAESPVQALTCAAQAPLEPCAEAEQLLQSPPPLDCIAHQLLMEAAAAVQLLQDWQEYAVPSMPT